MLGVSLSERTSSLNFARPCYPTEVRPVLNAKELLERAHFTLIEALLLLQHNHVLELVDSFVQLFEFTRVRNLLLETVLLKSYILKLSL